MLNTAGLEITKKARAMRNWHHATPEAFAAAGIAFDCNERDFSDAGEYKARLRLGLPTRAPRVTVGQWAYNYHAGENQRVLRVTWDAPVGSCRGFWRVIFPGFSTEDMNVSSAHEGAPAIEYAETAPCCWAPVIGPMPLYFSGSPIAPEPAPSFQRCPNCAYGAMGVGHEAPHTQSKGVPVIRISRTKIYPAPGRNYRTAWRYIYDVTAPDGSIVIKGTDLLAIARREAKKAAKACGGVVVLGWEVR